MVLSNLQRYLSFLALSVTLFVTVVPVAAIFSDYFNDAMQIKEIWALIFPTGRRLTLLLSSVNLALSSAVTCTVLSWFIGSFLWQHTRRYAALASYAAALLWFVALLPPFIHSYTWMALFSIVNQGLGLCGVNEIRFSGMVASWWTQTMAWMPLCLSAALLGFRCVDPDLVDAAQMSASPLKVLVSVITPVAIPALLSGGVLVFLMCLQDYSIPSLYQVSTYALDIFSDYSAHYRPFRALLMSVPLILISVAALAGAIPFFRHVSTGAPRLGRVQTAPFLLPGWMRILQQGFLFLLLIQVLMPLLVLIKTVGSWERLGLSVMASVPEIIYSAQTALLSALLAVSAAVVVTGSFARIWSPLAIPLTAFALSVPATLTGIGLIGLCGNFNPLNSDMAPVAAVLARFGPLALLIIMAQVSRLDQNLFEAAKFYQASRWRVWTEIGLPLMLPGIVVAFMTVFLLAMGELSATLLVLPPGRNTLAVKTYNLLHYGASDAVAGLCLFLVLTGWFIGTVATIVLIKRREAP